MMQVQPLPQGPLTAAAVQPSRGRSSQAETRRSVCPGPPPPRADRPALMHLAHTARWRVRCVHGMCLACAWHVRGVCMVYAWCVHGVCVAWGAHRNLSLSSHGPVDVNGVRQFQTLVPRSVTAFGHRIVTAFTVVGDRFLKITEACGRWQRACCDLQ